MSLKISIIGAGSGCFSLVLIRDLCLTSNLQGSTVCFMDINKQRLDAAHDVCMRYAQELGARLTLAKTLDRAVALDGADFVINTALAAPHERLREGWKIAQKYGFRFGGSYHVMYDEAFWVNFYQFKLFEAITEDMMRICPNAWHLMVANPVLAGITHLTRKYPEAKVIGLCHGYNSIYGMAKALGFDRKDITFQIPGLNHFVWLNRFYHKGQDAFPALDKWIAEESGRAWKDNGRHAINPKSVDLYKKWGVYPIGDTAGWAGASWPWWYHTDPEMEKRWAQNPTASWNGYFAGTASNAADFAGQYADTSLKMTDIYKPVPSHELMIPIVESMSCDIPRVLIVNVANRNEFVPGIPRDFEVEIPALVGRRGVQGIVTDPLPRHLIGHMLRDRVAPVEIELAAFNAGSMGLLEDLVLTDKWATSVDQVRSFIKEIMALPYHGEMAGHYR